MSICYEGYMTHKLSSQFHSKEILRKMYSLMHHKVTFNLWLEISTLLCSKWCFYDSITIKVLSVAINF